MRLIDGDKLLDWFEEQRENSGLVKTLGYIKVKIQSMIDSGAFDTHLNQDGDRHSDHAALSLHNRPDVQTRPSHDEALQSIIQELSI